MASWLRPSSHVTSASHRVTTCGDSNNSGGWRKARSRAPTPSSAPFPDGIPLKLTTAWNFNFPNTKH